MAAIQETVDTGAPHALPIYVARPDEEGPHPVVIVIFEIFGLGSHIKSVADRLAENGYVAGAPDFFRHEPAPYSDFQGARALAASLSDERALTEIRAALDYLERQPYALVGKAAVLGFCMGGRLAFLAACRLSDRFRAGVDFYGSRVPGGAVHPGQTLIPLDQASELKSPLLLLFGSEDQTIPPEDIEKIRSQLSNLGKSFESVVYDGAGHGFFCEERDSFHPDAAADAWGRTLKFLHEQIGEESIA